MHLLKKLTRAKLINSLIDCFGYSEEDFTGMSKTAILNYLEDEEVSTLAEYLI